MAGDAKGPLHENGRSMAGDAKGALNPQKSHLSIEKALKFKCAA